MQAREGESVIGQRAFPWLRQRFAGLNDGEVLRGYDDLRAHQVAACCSR